MTTKNEFRLMMSPLTNTLYAGRVKQKDGYVESVGARHDVTSDFFLCLLIYAHVKEGAFEVERDGRKWAVTVAEIKEQAEEENA